MNDPTRESSREQVSALADGALRGADLARAVEALCGSDDMRQAWIDYHAVGDALVADARRPCTDGAAFLSKFQQRLAAEAPLAIAPVAAPVVVPLRPREPETVTADRAEAANEPVFRWKLVSGVASLAAVAAIGWNLVGGGVPQQAAPQVAQQQVQQPVQVASRDAQPLLASVSSSAEATPSFGLRTQESARGLAGTGEPQVMLRDARLDQLLEAHRQAGGAAQMPSGFLRNATFDGPSR